MVSSASVVPQVRIAAFLQTKTAAWVLLAACLCLAVSLQLASNAHRTDFGSHGDESAHYVTGLLVRDYVTAADRSSPLAFARDYYLHYPRVMLGHWPPLFYVVEGVWMMLSEARLSLLLLMALLTSSLSLALFMALRKQVHPYAAAGVALLLPLLPAVQMSTYAIMSDTLTALLCYLATLACVRLVAVGGSRWALSFGVLASLAILTKGNAFALALVPAFSLLLLRRWERLQQPSFWLAAVPVVLLCGPWYVLTTHMVQGAWQHTFSEYVAMSTRFYSLRVVWLLGWPLLLVALDGLYVRVVRPWRQGQLTPFWASQAALLLSILLFQLLVPAALEVRYLLPAVLPLLAFLAAGATAITEEVIKRKPHWQYPGLLTAAALGCLFLLGPFRIEFKSNYGYRDAAADLHTHKDLMKRPILVSSGDHGEGIFIAEMALRDAARPNYIVLRGFQVLAEADFKVTQYKLSVNSPEQLLQRLRDLGVGTLVMDQRPGRSRVLHHRMLLDLVKQRPDALRPIGSAYPVPQMPLVRMYRVVGADTQPFDINRLRFILAARLEGSPLGKMLDP